MAKAKTALLERRSALLDKSEQRKTRLHDSFTYHQFDRDCDEAKGWFNEKLKVATDDSYLDPTIYITYCYLDTTISITYWYLDPTISITDSEIVNFIIVIMPITQLSDV